MLQKINIFEDVLIVGGITIGINQIYTILGIIILSFQIALILYKFICRIIQLIKKKKYDEIDDAIEDTTRELEHLSDTKKDGD